MKYHTAGETPEGYRFVTLERDALLRRVSKELYAEPTSGIRELLANEITAARKARSLGGNPTIEVTITPDMVRIQGFDSLGITRETFDEIYLHLGRSGNFDGKTPGQFGLGRASYVTISDHILIETHPRGEPPYAALGIEGRGYQTDFVHDGNGIFHGPDCAARVCPGGFPPPDIPHGTRVTMVPRGQSGGDVQLDMAETVRRMADIPDIPISLVTPLGRESLRGDPIAAHGPAGACITSGGVQFALNPGASNRAYLCGVPVGFTYRGSAYLDRFGLALNITDERRYPPTPDRERMSRESEERISGIIDGAMRDRYADFPADLHAAASHPEVRLALQFIPERLATLERIVESSAGSAVLWTILRSAKPVLNCRSFRGGKTAAVLSEFPGAVFVKGVPQLESLGSFMGRHGIAAPRGTACKPGMVLHDRTGHFRAVKPRCTVHSVSGRTELERYRPAMVGGHALVVRGDAPPVSELLAEALSTRWRTSAGTLTGSELHARRAPVYGTARPSLVEVWGEGVGGPSLLVLRTPRDALYGMLAAHFGRIRWHLEVWGGDERALEAYLRLKNPTHRHMVQAGARTKSILDGLMALEGLDPVPK